MPVNPSNEQLEALGALAGTAEDGPLVMLNLNRYRERAAYVRTHPAVSRRRYRATRPTSATG